MLEKLKRSIMEMPRAAYILLKNSLIICDISLICSFCLFISSEGPVESYEKTKLAWLAFETPPGILLLTLLGIVFILDRS